MCFFDKGLFADGCICYNTFNSGGITFPEVVAVNKHLNKGILILTITVVGYFALFAFMRRDPSEPASAWIGAFPVVMIDAGHGGEDGGAASVSGVLEKQINLEIALRMEQVLAFCGMEPQMIRVTDQSVYSGNCETLSQKKVSDLKNRVKMINTSKPALVISIHQNHYTEAKYAGAQVFYAPTDGSKQLATILQEHLRRYLDPDNRRQIKAAETVYLMNQINCTGVLVECGFLSNPKEEQLLQDPNYQIKLVSAAAGAIIQYLSEGTSGI